MFLKPDAFCRKNKKIFKQRVLINIYGKLGQNRACAIARDKLSDFRTCF